MERRVTRLETAHEHLATKADVAELRTEFSAKISELRVDMAKQESRIIRWMVGAMLGGMATAAAIAVAAVRLFGG